MGNDAKDDVARAAKLREAAHKHAEAAHKRWVAANELWQACQDELAEMHAQNLAASRDYAEAARLDTAAAKVIVAEILRHEAMKLRLDADTNHRRAFAFEVEAKAADVQIASHEAALKDPVVAKLPDTVKVIQAEVASYQAKAKAARDAARQAHAVAADLEKKAADKEKAAAVLDPKPVRQLPVVVVKVLTIPLIQASIKK